MDINTYNTKLAECNTKLGELNTQKILNDKAIADAEALFVTQFGTADLEVLEGKLEEYERGLILKEQELSELNTVFASM